MTKRRFRPHHHYHSFNLINLGEEILIKLTQPNHPFFKTFFFYFSKLPLLKFHPQNRRVDFLDAEKAANFAVPPPGVRTCILIG